MRMTGTIVCWVRTGVGRNCLVHGRTKLKSRHGTIHGENLGTVKSVRGSACQIYSNEEIWSPGNVIDVNHKGYTDIDLVVCC